MRWIVLAACTFWIEASFPQSPSAPSTLSLEDVVKLTRAGVAEELVITKVKKSGKAFDLTVDEILELKRSGLSDSVIQILLNPALPYAPAPLPPPATAATLPAAPVIEALKKPVDPIALAVPPEPGVYLRRASGDFGRLELKPVTAAKAGGKVVGVLTAGLKKGNVAGYVVGPAAKTRIAEAALDFYVRLPEKVAAEDIILIAVDSKKDRRNIGFGPDPAKPVFPPEMVKQYESTEVDKGLFRFQSGLLGAGEYLFLVLGSSEEKKGILAKAWEFGVNK